MDTISAEYFDCICRTCMHKIPETCSDPTNTEYADQPWKSLSDKIEECGALYVVELLSSTLPQIDVKINDDLPKRVCRKCLEQLLSVHRFKQMCIDSHIQMQELIVQRKTDLKVATEASIGNKRNTKEHSTHDPLLEIKFVSSSLEVPSTDPLQCTSSQAVINIEDDEPCDEDGNREDYSDGEIVLPMVPVINDKPCDEEESRDDYSDGEIVLPKAPVINDKPCVEEESLYDYSDDEILPPTVPNENITITVEKEKITNLSLSESSLLNPLQNQEQNGDIKSKPNTDKCFKCEICDKQYRKPGGLQRHLLTHNGDNQIRRKYICEICEKIYNSRHALWAHNQQKHLNKPRHQKLREIKCDICNRSFKGTVSFRQHVRTHTGEKPYLCPECGSSFRSASGLRMHRQRHDDAKLLECPYCPKKFRCRSDVTNHKERHNIEKPRTRPFVCNKCGSAFPKNDQLTRHLRIHGEKPFKCSFCDKSFVRSSAKQIHERTHTGEKPYKCKYCGRGFAQLNDHTKHLRIHLGENVYGCELCPLGFPLASEKRIHFVTHKNDDEETRERNLKALKEKEDKLMQLLGVKET